MTSIWLPPDAGVIKPAALFRLLTMAPRPTLALDSERAGLLHIGGSLSVVGLTSHEHNDGTTPMELVTASLMFNGRKAFAHVREVESLPVNVAERLAYAVMDALKIVSPMRSRCPFAEWRAVLCEGAAHPSNGTILMALGRCYDASQVGSFTRLHARPDRYIGVPMHAVTDGQWMAAEAARAVIEEKYS